MCKGARKQIADGDLSVTDKISYQELLGCLLFIATRTRPEITDLVSILCPYTSTPNQVHGSFLKKILLFLEGGQCFALGLSADKNNVLIGNWAEDRIDRRSSTDVLLQLGIHLLPVRA